MKIKIYGNNDSSQNLFDITKKSLESLGLSDFVILENIFNDEIVKKLEINSDVAFIVEEESIDFEDVIFQGEIPNESEINNLIISLVGGSNDSCSSGCSSCSGSCGIY